jgi:adenylosuccinate lyase
MNSKLAAMISGYGLKFIGLQELFGYELTRDDRERLESPIPGLGRYRDSTDFLCDITSGRRLGLLRFKVMKEYFFALARVMKNYNGKFKDQKIIKDLSAEDIERIQDIGITAEEVRQAELIERVTEHDTAAAGDYLKLKTLHFYPHLEPSAEGLHFGSTSEDPMSIVMGIMGNELFGYFIKFLSTYCLDQIVFVESCEQNGPLIIPEFTHQQSAEPIALSTKSVIGLNAIKYLVSKLMIDRNTFQPFSGKMGGATGQLMCHYAAYPDIDWWTFARDFVESFGLHYEPVTAQSVTYVVEAQIFMTITAILNEVIKITSDFLSLASCPAQLFVKIKKVGVKGSSLMPGKSNGWGQEGGRKMLRKSIALLFDMARELMDFPHGGDMGRSYLFRDLGNVFMPIFIALPRITKELKSYQPNPGRISWILNEYPGMAGSSIQTVLKRAGIDGDPYRELQKISINDDGSYANSEQFGRGLELFMDKFQLPVELREELRGLLNWQKLVEPAAIKAKEELAALKIFFGNTFYAADKLLYISKLPRDAE